MLDSIENKNSVINEMYKGDELVWKLPMCMLEMSTPKTGERSIAIRFYPYDAKVTITIMKSSGVEKVYDGSNRSGEVTVTVDEITLNDKITVRAEAVGWESSSYRRTIRR